MRGKNSDIELDRANFALDVLSGILFLIILVLSFIPPLRQLLLPLLKKLGIPV